MKHTLNLSSGCLLDALITVFEKNGFIRIGKKVFKVIGYRPGPGAVNWDCEFDLEDYIEGQTADAMISLPADTPHATVRPTWNGPQDGLPPVGVKVTIENPQGYNLVCDETEWLGPEVKVVHTYRNPFCVDLVVVERDDGAAQVFRASMCRPIQTAEQLTAEEREKWAEALFDRLYPCYGWRNVTDVIRDRYRAEYDRRVQP